MPKFLIVTFQPQYINIAVFFPNSQTSSFIFYHLDLWGENNILFSLDIKLI